MIIDCHCHAGKGDGLTGPWDTEATLERYLVRASHAGIGRTVLFAAFHSDFARANREVARIVATRPDRFFGFAFVDSVADRGRVRDMVRAAVEEFGFCGVKVHRFHGDITREVIEAAQAYALPILYDVMGNVSAIDLFAGDYRDVNFIIPHLGSFADNWRANTSMIDRLVRFANVHTDTSAVQRFDLLEEAVRRAGARKLLFGSDGPWLHPGVELEKVRLLRLGSVGERLVCAGNLLRLIGREERSATDSGDPHGAAVNTDVERVSAPPARVVRRSRTQL